MAPARLSTRSSLPTEAPDLLAPSGHPTPAGRLVQRFEVGGGKLSTSTPSRHTSGALTDKAARRRRPSASKQNGAQPPLAAGAPHPYSTARQQSYHRKRLAILRRAYLRR